MHRKNKLDFIMHPIRHATPLIFQSVFMLWFLCLCFTFSQLAEFSCGILRFSASFVNFKLFPVLQICPINSDQQYLRPALFLSLFMHKLSKFTQQKTDNLLFMRPCCQHTGQEKKKNNNNKRNQCLQAQICCCCCCCLSIILRAQ